MVPMAPEWHIQNVGPRRTAGRRVNPSSSLAGLYWDRAGLGTQREMCNESYTRREREPFRLAIKAP
jgi:hypothetical protein